MLLSPKSQHRIFKFYQLNTIIMGLFNTLFNANKKQDIERIKELILAEAIIIDVRSEAEFRSGSAKGAINIPLNELKKNLNKIITLNKPIITVCASGMRSGKATDILKKEGLVCENGKTWKNVNQFI